MHTKHLQIAKIYDNICLLVPTNLMPMWWNWQTQQTQNLLRTVTALLGYAEMAEWQTHKTQNLA